jgi:outer membrane protein OmpA-like peptidoglycan-associated protein
MDYEYEDESEGGSSLVRKIALGVGVLAVAALGWFVVTYVAGGKDNGQVKQGDAAAATTVAPTTTNKVAAAAEKTKTTAPSSAASTAPTSAEPTTTATVAPAADPTPPPTAAPTTAAAATYPTNVDGTPAWVVVIFDTNAITISGQVPDQAAKDRLTTLATTYAKPGEANTINNNVQINPAMPRSVGVRVVELTSARFPDGSAVIEGDHAAELDRVVAAMTALPNTTALVIGHADQRGNEVSNYVLSVQRAQAVVDYMASKGIDPTRLSSKAVGEQDLLDLHDDAAAFALNKRTEFVLFGLLEG